MKSILIALTMVFSLSLVDSKREEPVDIWYRTAPDLDNEGQIITVQLDMRTGYAYCDGEFIYIMVKKKDIDELVVMTFANGDYWVNDESYWTTQEDLQNDRKDRFLKNHFNKGGGKIERLD